jgi:hypothetical protein
MFYLCRICIAFSGLEAMNDRVWKVRSLWVELYNIEELIV